MQKIKVIDKDEDKEWKKNREERKKITEFINSSKENMEWKKKKKRKEKRKIERKESILLNLFHTDCKIK